MNINEIQPTQLVIYDRDGLIKTIYINQQQVVIGRDTPTSTCDILLASEFVSSVHGSFIFNNGEYYYVDDATNMNGTFINGKRIPKEPGQPSAAQKLRDGDILSIGKTEISKERTVYILFSTTTSIDYIWNAFLISALNMPIIIGRDSRISNIHIPETIVSKRHAQIIRDSYGNISVTDLNSANGTILNGRLIKSNVHVPFKERDTIIIGSVKIIHFGNVIIYNEYAPAYMDDNRYSYNNENNNSFEGYNSFGSGENIVSSQGQSNDNHAIKTVFTHIEMSSPGTHYSEE